MMIELALQTNSHIQEEATELDWTYTGAPFFSSVNYRLMNFPHLHMHRDRSSKIRHFQHTTNSSPFNTTFKFKKSIVELQKIHYIDEIMGLLCILNDGPMYIERRAFVMLLSALLRTEPKRLLDPLFLNPIHFPFTWAMSWLVFDRQLNNYDV